MLNFHKIAAASKGRLILRYFTEDTPEPIHPPALDEAGRTLEGPAVIPLRRPRCAGRLRRRVRAPAREAARKIKGRPWRPLPRGREHGAGATSSLVQA